MKTIFRFFNLALLLAAFMAVGTTASFAQDACADVDGQNAVYTKFTENYAKKPLDDMKAALATGKEFLEKYGACEALKDQIDFVKPQVARLEKVIPIEELRGKLLPLYKRLDAGIGVEPTVYAKNPDEVFAAGKEILALQPDNFNIVIPMALVGLYESYRENNKFADESLKYAKSALDQLKAGKEADRKNKAGVPSYGVLKYEYPKAELVSELTYAMGHLTFYVKKDKKTALPYFYELSQGTGVYKTDPRVYAPAGDYYISEAAPIGNKIAELIAAQKSTTDTDEVKLAREGEIKAKIALYNGYIERAIDAFGRAYSVAKADTPASKTYKDGLYKQIQGLYERRFEKKDGIDAYIASAVAKPMPNPTSEVKPVADPEPVKPDATTTTTPAATPTKPATTSVKPAEAPAKVSTVLTAMPSETATAVKTKPAAKKAVVKKKGTR